MKTRMKTIVLTLVLALFAGGSAFAATGGRIPILTDDFLSDESVNEDAYQNHGEDVSDVAHDQEATGTKTTPNGKTIENHGQAVQEAAHEGKDMDDNDSIDEENDDMSSDTGEGNGNGNASQQGDSDSDHENNAGGNSGNAHSD